ncbi:MAG: hypothetical protein RRY55_01210 [Bacteroidales bacterium]
MIRKEWEHRHIELCGICNGAGILYLYDEMDIIRQREAKEAVCQYCNGTGRVLKSKEIVIEVEPFDVDKSKRAGLVKNRWEDKV